MQPEKHAVELATASSAPRLSLTGCAAVPQVAGRDKVWSDNSDGSGSNWLGLQLMLRRDELRGGGEGGWTGFIRAAVDLQTGTPRSDAWQCAVRSANADLTRAMR